MHILLVAATPDELNPVAEWLKTGAGQAHGHQVELLYSGVGSTLTAASLGKRLCSDRPELIIQAGIAGSFVPSLPPGSLAFVSEEVFADLGVVENGIFLDQFDLGLAGSDDHPFAGRRLKNPQGDYWKSFGLEWVAAATINCISSGPDQINRIVGKYHPALESMEGAAVHYICLIENIPFVQLRAVSNYVGERDKSRWKLAAAIDALNRQLRTLLEVFPVAGPAGWQ